MAADQQQTELEPRRSRSFPPVVPVEVKWQEPSGKIFKEAGSQRGFVGCEFPAQETKPRGWFRSGRSANCKSRPHTETCRGVKNGDSLPGVRFRPAQSALGRLPPYLDLETTS